MRGTIGASSILLAGALSAPVAAQTEQAELLASDAAADHRFGRAVALSGDTAVVGSLAGGVVGAESGSAYVFVRAGGAWTQQQKLVADDAAAGDQFGFALAVDGDTLVVGAYADDHSGLPNAGSAYVFVRDGSTWTQEAKLVASDPAQGDLFGRDVDVEGDTVVVGAYTDDDLGSQSGSVYVFDRVGGTWTETAKLTASDGAAGDLYGESVDLSGDTLLVGSHLDDDNGLDSGSAYVHVRDGGGTWTEQAKLVSFDGGPGDHYAESVALRGDTVLVGSVHIDDDRGAAYVYRRTGTTWALEQKLVAADASPQDLFGFAVALAPETAVIGCFLDDDLGVNSGSAYVYVRDGTTWTARSKLLASDGAAVDQAGLDVAADGDTALLGAHQHDHGGDDTGAVYVFLSATSPWIDLGGGSPGAAGYPDLDVSGPLTAGSTLSIDLGGAPATTPTLLWLSTSTAPLDVLGGTLHANPKTSQFLRVTDGGGAWSEAAPWPPGVPSGAPLWLQVIVQDPTVPAGLTLSNAVTATTP